MPGAQYRSLAMTKQRVKSTLYSPSPFLPLPFYWIGTNMSSSSTYLWRAGRRYCRIYSSCAAKPSRARQERSPIAYHFLRNPIPYDIGLQLQENILDTRVKWRAQKKDQLGVEGSPSDGGKGDIILLLGKSPSSRLDSSLYRASLQNILPHILPADVILLSPRLQVIPSKPKCCIQGLLFIRRNEADK